MKALILSALLMLSYNSYAHEGAHGPEQKMAPHGGVVKDGKELMVELVPDDLGVKIYFLTHESKSISPADVKVNPKSIQLTDSKKKPVKTDIVIEKEFILLKFDKTSSYRFSLTVPVSYKNKLDQFHWQFEPQAN